MTIRTKIGICRWVTQGLLLGAVITPFVVASHVRGITDVPHAPETAASLVVVIFALALWLVSTFWTEFIIRRDKEEQK